ncbi:MAG: sigma-54 dependent transcriptional regulator [Acidobacteria bacterium]|nr:sigma-54 dependent transcriptional regulator [Acidobacteriota bacterium]
MKRTLVAWIGHTDLRAARGDAASIPGPIGSAIEKRNYGSIALLSNLSKSENSEYVKWLKSRTQTPINLYQLALSSPMNFGEIYRGVVDVIEKLRDNRGSIPDLTFHLSPGTSAMAAVWIILSKTRFPAELIEASKQEGVHTTSIPFDISAEFIPDLLRRPDEELKRLTPGLPPETPLFADIIHRSSQMKQVIELARRVAVHKVPVLIEGESGTGKELMARAIHRASLQRDKPFIAVNCGAIPAELVESELFGHEKGAFTGASQKRFGHFVKADGGTIFLDEVGELPLPAQVKLLRVVQEQEIMPVGSSHPSKVDVRVISATNRTLINEVAQGGFREDLFYRLAVFILHLPPLRDREGDVGLLIDKLLLEVNEQITELSSEHKKLSPGARNLLLGYNWPGNVREMKNTLLRAAVMSSGQRITEDEIRQSIFSPPAQDRDQIVNRSLDNGFSLQKVLTEVAQHYLRRALKQAHGNKSEAAKLVGLPSYQTFTNWLKKYDMENG